MKDKEVLENTSTYEEKPKKKIGGSAIIIAACVVIVLITIFGAKSCKNKKSDSPFGKGPMGMQQNEFSVKTEFAKKKTLHDYISTNGEVETQNSVDVFPSIGGKVVKVNVTLGSVVKKGDVLVEIDPSEPGAAYAHSPVIAPIGGTITCTPVKIGTTVSNGKVITTIGDVQNLQVSASIPEKYVGVLKTGLKADIVLEAYPDEKIPASVTRVSPVVDKMSRTKEIIMNFDKRNSHANAGMFAKVTLWTLDYSGAVVVPSDAIITKEDIPYVFVISEGTNVAKQVQVKVGKSVDGETQILEGVSEGELVVIEGMRVLGDGSLVRDVAGNVVKPESAETEEKQADSQNEGDKA